MKHIALVVEGPGDREAVPKLLRDHLASSAQFAVGVGYPLAAKGRDKLLAEEKLEAFVRQAGRVPGACGVLVVFDADGDAACKVGPDALARATAATHLPVRICVAIQTFENWIAASAETVFDVGIDAPPPVDFEGKGAMGLIKKGLHPTKYVKPVYQARLTSRIDHSVARDRCPSLARLFRCVDELVASA
jgi:hypothetical protein